MPVAEFGFEAVAPARPRTSVFVKQPMPGVPPMAEAVQRMLIDKLFNYLFTFFFVIGEIVHSLLKLTIDIIRLFIRSVKMADNVVGIKAVIF